jgi:hypothetical protein
LASDEKNSLPGMRIDAVLHPAAKVLTEQGAQREARITLESAARKWSGRDRY